MYVVQERRATDLKAQKLVKGSSGYSLFLHGPTKLFPIFETENLSIILSDQHSVRRLAVSQPRKLWNVRSGVDCAYQKNINRTYALTASFATICILEKTYNCCHPSQQLAFLEL